MFGGHWATRASPKNFCAVGRVRDVQPGEILFEPGDTHVPFFVILSGALEIVQPGFDGERQIVAHAAGGFTGEMSMISGTASLIATEMP